MGGKRQVGTRELQGARALCAEADGGQRLSVEAEAGGGGDHALPAHLLGQADGDRVEALGEGVRQADKAVVAVAEVFRRPALHHQGRVHTVVPWAEAGFQRGEVHERLEGGAGLAAGLHGAVELAVGVGRAAHHREHVAVRAQNHDGGLFRAAGGVEAEMDGGLGGELDIGVERGVDVDVGGDEAEARLHFGPEPVGGGVDAARGRWSADA